MSSQSTLVSLRGVSKIYGNTLTQVAALNNINVDIRAGEFTAIVGPSGSGKSTFLHCLAGLDTVTTGSVQIAGTEISGLSDKKLTRFRRDHIGFIFQAFNLIPTLTADENITLPQRLARKKVDENWKQQVVKALQLQDRLSHRPGQLSGGQQQRVAVARTLVARPALLVADEPTGNLDSKSSREVLHLLRQAVKELGQTVVMVTHDHHAAALADRVLVIKDGQVAYDLPHPTAEQIATVI